MPPLIDQSRCIGCGVCMEICPMPEVTYGDECWHCNSCVLDCRQQALSLRIPAPFMMLHVNASELEPGRR